MTEMTKEELLGYKAYLTVGELKKFIEKYNISDDAIIVTEIVEDKYFNRPDNYDGSEWALLFKNSRDRQVPYHPVWSPVMYSPNEKDIIYLDLHY